MRCAAVRSFEVPPQLRRTGHAASAYGGEVILVFGGRNGDTFLGDLWAFKPATGDWKCLDTQAPFAARAHHTCTVVGDSLWVVGGSNKEEVFDDVHVFDLRNRNWTAPLLRGVVHLLHCTAHGACTHPQRPDTILLHAGYGFPSAAADQPQWLSDVVAINTLRSEVGVLSVTGFVPEGRAYHTWTCVGSRCLALGGRHGKEPLDGPQLVGVFDVPSLRWLPPAPTSGMPMTGRSTHSAVALDGSHLLIFGGYNASGRLNDFYLLHADGGSTGKLAWQDWTSVVAAAAASSGTAGGGGAAAGSMPSMRGAHVAEVVGGSVYILGGTAGKTKDCVEDGWRIDIAPDVAALPQDKAGGGPASGQASQWRSTRRGRPAGATAEPLAGPSKRGRVAAAGTRAAAAAAVAAAAAAPASQAQAAAGGEASPGPSQSQPDSSQQAQQAQQAQQQHGTEVEAGGGRVGDLQEALRVREQLEAELARVQAELLASKAACQQAERERDKYLGKLQEERGRARGVYDRAKQETAQDVERQATVFARERNALQATAREREGRIDKLEDDLETARTALRRERAEWNETDLQRQRQIDQLQQDRDTLRESSKKVQDELGAASRKADRLQRALDEERAAHAASRTEAAEDRRRLLEATNAEKSAAAVARSEKESLQARLGTAEEGARQAQADLGQLKRQHVGLEERAARAESEAQRLQQELARLKADHSRVLSGLRAKQGAFEQQLKQAESALGMLRLSGQEIFGLAPD